MQTKLKIICGDSQEKLIIDTSLLQQYSNIDWNFVDTTNWMNIFAILRWIEEKGIEVKHDYKVGKKLTITRI